MGLDESCGQIVSIRARSACCKAPSNLVGLGPIASKGAIERENVGGTLFHRCVRSVKGALGGGSDETKNECSDRGDESDANPDRVFRPRVEVMRWQDPLQPHPEHRAAERTRERDNAGTNRIHSRVHGWSTSRSRWAGSDSRSGPDAGRSMAQAVLGQPRDRGSGSPLFICRNSVTGGSLPMAAARHRRVYPAGARPVTRCGDYPSQWHWCQMAA